MPIGCWRIFRMSCTAFTLSWIVVPLLLYRALHPAWAFAPLSGEGAAQNGGRWNRKGQQALYLSTDPMTALAEYNQDFLFRPVTLAQYRVTQAKLADLSDSETLKNLGLSLDIHSTAWRALTLEGKEPATWHIADTLMSQGIDGVLFPSVASPLGRCVALWHWNENAGPQISVSDTDHRLPLDQASWRNWADNGGSR
jgi:RES domain-containing protein